MLKRVNEEQQEAILSRYEVTGPTKRNSPAFAAYQNKHHMDREKLLKAWEVYIEMWTDPDLMDKLKDSDYSIEVFREADKGFTDRIAE